MNIAESGAVDSPLNWDAFMNDLDTTLQDVAEFDPTLPPLEPNPDFFVEAFKDYLTRELNNIILVKMEDSYRYVIKDESAADYVTFVVDEYTSRLFAFRMLTDVGTVDQNLELTQFTLPLKEEQELGTFFVNEIKPQLWDLRKRQLMEFMKDGR